MRFEINLAFCVLVVLTGSPQTGGQISALPPVVTLAPLQSHTGPSASPDLTEDPGNEFSQRTLTLEDETSTETTPITKIEGTVPSQTDAAYKTHVLTTSSAVTTSEHTNVPVVMTAHTAAADGLSSTPPVQSTAPLQHTSTTEGRATLTADPFATFSSQPALTEQDTGSTAHAASTIQSDSLATASGPSLTPATGLRPAGPTHRDAPPQLNVGDEDLKGSRSRSPLDPLLAGLLSVFIVTTAVVFIVLFVKFRQRTNHPEFHRLQDLPMDDLMEDTPLSRYTY